MRHKFTFKCKHQDVDVYDGVRKTITTNDQVAKYVKPWHSFIS